MRGEKNHCRKRKMHLLQIGFEERIKGYFLNIIVVDRIRAYVADKHLIHVLIYIV